MTAATSTVLAMMGQFLMLVCLARWMAVIEEIIEIPYEEDFVNVEEEAEVVPAAVPQR